jgi:rhamnosyltransferase
MVDKGTETAPRIAAVTVLYYPQPDLAESLMSYLHQVEHLYLVDNSDGVDHQRLIDTIAGKNRISYLPQQGNIGIAAALNRGAKLALADGYGWLLTMDQDSQAAADMVQRQLSVLERHGSEKVGMLAPFHLTRAERTAPAQDESDVMTPMTSGCLLNLRAYQDVGAFRDDFFIDFVDNEYCLRLRRHGWRVLRANHALLTHNVGDITKIGPFIATHHSPLRRYYKTRNRLQVFRDYLGSFPGHCLFDLVRLAKEIGSIVLFETDKTAKLAMMVRGVFDFFRGRFGRYQ